jgi:hypothetical protein
MTVRGNSLFIYLHVLRQLEYDRITAVHECVHVCVCVVRGYSWIHLYLYLYLFQIPSDPYKGTSSHTTGYAKSGSAGNRTRTD